MIEIGEDLYVEPEQERADRNSDELDKAFSNVLQGKNITGIAVVLERDGEELEYYNEESRSAAVEKAMDIIEEYDIQFEGELDYERLLRD